MVGIALHARIRIHWRIDGQCELYDDLLRSGRNRRADGDRFGYRCTARHHLQCQSHYGQERDCLESDMGSHELRCLYGVGSLDRCTFRARNGFNRSADERADLYDHVRQLRG